MRATGPLATNNLVEHHGYASEPMAVAARRRLEEHGWWVGLADACEALIDSVPQAGVSAVADALVSGTGSGRVPRGCSAGRLTVRR